MNGQPVPNWEELAERLAASSGPVTLDVLRPRAVNAPRRDALGSTEPVALNLAAACRDASAITAFRPAT